MKNRNNLKLLSSTAVQEEHLNVRTANHNKFRQNRDILILEATAIVAETE
jgi:hypothetical protein